MSKGYRDGAFALGLVVGGGIALNLVLWLDYQKSEEANQAPNGQNEPDYSQVGQYWDGFIGAFISPSDTLAQWIMATFTIAATIVLVFTLRSANKTNKAAIKASEAALEANRIMRNEQRPWLVLNRDLNCEFRDIGDRCTITWNYEFENRGKNPAYDGALNYAFIKRAHYMHMRTQMDQYLQHVLSTRRQTGMPVIFSGEKTDFIKYYSSSGSLYQKDEFSVYDFSDEGHIMMMACLSYRLSQDSDIFGYDVRMLDIEEPKRWAGPWAHTLLEHAEARLIG